MALQQDDVQSWSPSAPPEQSDAAAMLADLSAHRPAARTGPAGPSGPTGPSGPGTPSAPVPAPAAPANLPTTPAPVPSALPAENPTSPGFSPDGRFWWDGRRWTPTESLERTPADGVAGGRRRWTPALVGAGVVVGLVAVLMLAALPVLWNSRAAGSDEVLQTALLEVAEAQQQHLIDHGRFAADDGALTLYLLRLGAVPDVTFEVRASDEMTFCVAATAADGATLWVSESGEVTSAPCA